MEEEPYLVYEEEDCPWWMWPLLTKVTITRDQWETRIIMVVVTLLLGFLLATILYGLWGILFVLILAAIGLLFLFNTYKYGRKKAIEYSERLTCPR